MKLQQIHFADEYLSNTRHPISISLIGVGGNGTIALYRLAEINLALLELGKPGISVTAYDNDKVEEHNLLRQKFSYSDIGEFKSSVVINRINRLYGFNWEAVPKLFTQNDKQTNIYIGCTDTIKSRKIIQKNFIRKTYANAVNRPLYYLDIGNSKDTSQFILGSKTIKQPQSNIYKTVDKLNTFIDEFKDLNLLESNESSCSAYESLARQGLFTNTIVTTHALNLIWQLFFDKYILYRGGYINSQSGYMKPVPFNINEEAIC